ncbi:MAG: tetratricopeptide repeat protein [candidate division Zixibacteria bacterium]|nr:tetratricopeptide repeat protein [candidate division Zixibacteria bacterium]
MKDALRRYVPPAAVVAAALAVRLVYFAEFRDFPLFFAATGDTVEYARQAHTILAGELLGRGVYFHSSPAYPYFIGAVKLVTWGGFAAFRDVALLQLLVSVATAALVFLLGKRLAGTAAGVVAGLIYALSPTAAFYDGELLMDFLLPAVLAGVALLASTKRWSLGRAAGAGALIALGALARPSYLLLLLPAALAIWFLAEGTSRLARGKYVAALVAAAALVVAPCAVRNYVVGRDVVLISSNGGVNLLIGNNPQASGTFKAPEPWAAHLEALSTAYAEEKVGRPLKPSEVSAYFTREAVKYALTLPDDYLTKVGRRLRLLASAYEIPNHMDFNFFRPRSGVLKILPFTWGIIFPWALAGGVLAAPRRKFWPALALAVVYLGSLATLFFVTGRYRFPAFALLAVFAAAGAVALVEAARARAKWKLAVGAAVLVGGYVAAYWPAPADVKVSAAYSYHHLGGAYVSLGDDRAAAGAYEKAVALEPEDAFSWNNLGLAYIRLADVPAAERALGRALELTPDNPSTLNSYGTLLLYRGRYAEAERYVGAALARDPNNVPALVNYGIVLLVRRDLDGALRTLERATALNPRYANAYFNMGLVYEARGDIAAAAAAYRRALQLNPGNADARRRLAAITGRGPRF